MDCTVEVAVGKDEVRSVHVAPLSVDFANPGLLPAKTVVSDAKFGEYAMVSTNPPSMPEFESANLSVEVAIVAPPAPHTAVVVSASRRVVAEKSSVTVKVTVCARAGTGTPPNALNSHASATKIRKYFAYRKRLACPQRRNAIGMRQYSILRTKNLYARETNPQAQSRLHLQPPFGALGLQ